MEMLVLDKENLIPNSISLPFENAIDKRKMKPNWKLNKTSKQNII
jgi:hypothetical protein